MATKYITQNGKFLKWGDKYVIVVGDSVTGDPASGDSTNSVGNFVQGTKLYTLHGTVDSGMITFKGATIAGVNVSLSRKLN